MKIQEEFTNELIPGETYYFNYRGKTVSGKFKRATRAWKIFEDDNGNEMLINSWSNVATTPEDIEGVERAVDAMEKDIKLPSRVPNRFTKAPNRHGFVESTLREGIYGYQTFTSTGERGKPVYTFTYASRDKIAKYDKGNYTLTLYKEWVNHIKSLIEWLNEYYPGFFVRQSSPDSASFSRFNPTEEEAVQYIKDQIRRGKVFTESKINESTMDLTSDIQRATDAIAARKDKYKSNDALCDSIYSAISDCLHSFQFIDKDKNEVLNDIYQKELKRLNIEDTLNESNELEKRAKKHKKKSKGMSMFGLKPDAGNVEINNKAFNAMNNVNNSPSTNPTGPMGEEMTKLEAMTRLNRLNEENSNERDFAIYCNNAFGKYKVATWKATDAETAVAEFKELNPKYTKTGLITAVEI